MAFSKVKVVLLFLSLAGWLRDLGKPRLEIRLPILRRFHLTVACHIGKGGGCNYRLKSRSQAGSVRDEAVLPNRAYEARDLAPLILGPSSKSLRRKFTSGHGSHADGLLSTSNSRSEEGHQSMPPDPPRLSYAITGNPTIVRGRDNQHQALENAFAQYRTFRGTLIGAFN
jgi:hypothetical protein